MPNVDYYGLSSKIKVDVKCCANLEGIWGSGGKGPLILNLGIG